jgi:hypothetical protein
MGTRRLPSREAGQAVNTGGRSATAWGSGAGLSPGARPLPRRNTIMAPRKSKATGRANEYRYLEPDEETQRT